MPLMKLTRATIQNYRSFPERTDLALAEGMNALVGPNNCGKSNFIRAVGMALDPDYSFDAASDVPGQRKFAFPRTTLTFTCEGKTSSEKTLLRYAREYERSVVGPGKPTYAEAGEIRLVVTYRGNQTSGQARQEYLASRGAGDRRGDSALNAKAIKQLRKVVRFATVDTGESISSVLNGKFRDILHGVLKEHMATEFGEAVDARGKYVGGLQEQLLMPLRGRLLGNAVRLFPEVNELDLIPKVSSIEETLSNVDIRINDSVDTPLAAKGMGVTGAVVIALLRYLADASKQSLIFAIEEPESFLHPGAQEELRDDLEGLAERNDITLLVTTHSPFILSRAPKAQVIAIEKGGDGASRIAASARGDEPQASAISGLFGDGSIPQMLDRYAAVPATAEAILLVEGETDVACLDAAATSLGRSKELARVHLIPAGGTDPLTVQAILLRAETSRPVVALVDSDENGRKARDLLTKRFAFPKADVLEYGKILGSSLDVEAEWFFEADFMQEFVDANDEEVVLKSKQKLGGEFRYDFTPAGKGLFVDWVRENGSRRTMSRWADVLDALAERIPKA